MNIFHVSHSSMKTLCKELWIFVIAAVQQSWKMYISKVFREYQILHLLFFRHRWFLFEDFFFCKSFFCHMFDKERSSVLTFQPCSRAGLLGWQSDLFLYSPRCCYCRYTWQDKSLHRCCKAAGLKIPGVLKRQSEGRICIKERNMELLQVCEHRWICWFQDNKMQWM